MEQNSHPHSNEQSQLQSHQEPLRQIEYEIITSEEAISLPYRKAYDMMEKFAATRIGQFVMKRGDRLLRIIETTAKWSVPKPNTDYRLQRPLPWIPFLMLILVLRLVRVWVSVAALLIGNAPIKPNDVVYFVQTRRRKLRALRLRGVKEIKRTDAEKKTIEAANRGKSLISSLRKLFSSAICRPGQHRGVTEHRVQILGEGAVLYDSVDRQAAKRTRIDDESDPNITVDDMLNKYADDSATDDPDYVPRIDEETDDTSGTSEASSESADEGEALLDESASDVNRSVEIENGEKGEIIPKPMPEIKQEIASDNENSENQLKTPYGNGPINGGENRETDVALRFMYTPPHEEVDNQNLAIVMDTKNAHKSTPGHISAAKALISLKSTATVVPKLDELITTTTDDLVSSNCVTSFAFDSSKNFPLNKTKISSTNSSPNLSAATSNSSIDSFLINEEIVNKNKEFLTATSTPTHETDDDNKTDELTCTKQTPISSSEDDFYSPIGSPPNFMAYQQRPSSFGFSDMSTSQGQAYALQKILNEPIVENQLTDKTKQNQQNLGNENGKGNSGHHQHRRNKWRNRRQQQF